jgi:hypothetical protein
MKEKCSKKKIRSKKLEGKKIGEKWTEKNPKNIFVGFLPEVKLLTSTLSLW